MFFFYVSFRFFFCFHGDAHNNKTRHYSMHHRVYRRFCFCFKGVPQTNGRVQSHTFLALKNSFFVCLFFSFYLVVVCCIQSVGVSCLQHLLIHLPVERTCNEIIVSFSVSVWWWQWNAPFESHEWNETHTFVLWWRKQRNNNYRRFTRLFWRRRKKKDFVRITLRLKSIQLLNTKINSVFVVVSYFKKKRRLSKKCDLARRWRVLQWNIVPQWRKKFFLLLLLPIPFLLLFVYSYFSLFLSFRVLKEQQPTRERDSPQDDGRS